MSGDFPERAPNLTIATDADVPEVVSLINRAFRGRGEEAGWSIKEEYIEGTRITEDLLREDMAAKQRATLLLWREADDDLLGCVWIEPEQEGIWYLGTLTIAPHEQKRRSRAPLAPRGRRLGSGAGRN